MNNLPDLLDLLVFIGELELVRDLLQVLLLFLHCVSWQIQ